MVYNGYEEITFLLALPREVIMVTGFIEYVTQYYTYLLFAAALFFSTAWLLYFFFRLNRDVFRTIDIVIIINGAAAIIQIVLLALLRNFVLTGVLAFFHVVAVIFQLFSFLFLRPKRVEFQRGAKIAVLPFLTEGAEGENWETGYGLADLFSRVLSTYDISVSSPTRVAAGFLRQNIDDDAKAVEWGRLLEADYMIIGSARFVRDNVQVRYRILKIAEGIEWRRRRFLEKKENLFLLAEKLVDDLVELFGLTLRNAKAREYYKAPTKSLEAWRYYCEGRRYQILPTGEDLENATRVYNEATTLDEDFALASISTAESYLSLARKRVHEESEFLDFLERAYRIALKVVKTHPELYESQNIMGEAFVFLSGGRDKDLFKRAQTRFLEAVRLYPSSARSWYNLALISKYTTEDIEESGYIEFLEKSLTSDPSFIPSRLALARYLAEHDGKDEGEEHYKRALEFNPGNVQIHNEVGFFFIKENRNAEAIEILEKAREIESNNHQTRHYLGLAYMRAGHLEEAEEELRAAIPVRPKDIQLRYSLSKILEKAEKYGEAVKVLEEAADLVATPADRKKIQQHINTLTAKVKQAKNGPTGPAVITPVAPSGDD
jgi:tetratricopeptide (TPR) repeat protein